MGDGERPRGRLPWPAQVAVGLVVGLTVAVLAIAAVTGTSPADVLRVLSG